MTFGDAVTALLAGKTVTRPAMGPGNVVVQVTAINGAPVKAPFFGLRTAAPDGLITWTPQQADMAAADWVEVTG